MADISQFYPGNDNHPVDEAGAARSIDQRGFDNAAQGPLPEGHYRLAHWTTSATPGGTPPGFIVTPGSNDLFLPDGQIFTPSGTGIDPTTAETRYVRRDVSQTFDSQLHTLFQRIAAKIQWRIYIGGFLWVRKNPRTSALSTTCTNHLPSTARAQEKPVYSHVLAARRPADTLHMLDIRWGCDFQFR